MDLLLVNGFKIPNRSNNISCFFRRIKLLNVIPAGLDIYTTKINNNNCLYVLSVYEIIILRVQVFQYLI